MRSRQQRNRLLILFGVLLLLQFYVRPRLWNGAAAPDFLVLGLLIYAMRSRPGNAAVAGLLVGRLSDALTPARFGAGALAHTVVGYLASWGRLVFFADNLVASMGIIFVGVWLRNLIVLFASGLGPGTALMDLGVWSPLQGLTTAVAGAVILVFVHEWLEARHRE